MHLFPSPTQFIDHLITELNFQSQNLSYFRSPSNHPEDNTNSICISTNPQQQHQHQHQPQLSTINPHAYDIHSQPHHQLFQNQSIKSLLLNFHFFFPNELLLALDILDRNLARYITITNNQEEEKEEESLFFVISSSSTPKSSDNNINQLQKGHQVHLHAWNCTCPAFIFSSVFKSSDLANPSDYNIQNYYQHHYPFGGSLSHHQNTHPPILCKHLLACLLAVRCPALFGHGLLHHSVNQNLFAALSAGWAG